MDRELEARALAAVADSQRLAKTLRETQERCHEEHLRRCELSRAKDAARAARWRSLLASRL